MISLHLWVNGAMSSMIMIGIKTQMNVHGTEGEESHRNLHSIF